MRMDLRQALWEGFGLLLLLGIFFIIGAAYFRFKERTGNHFASRPPRLDCLDEVTRQRLHRQAQQDAAAMQAQMERKAEDEGTDRKHHSDRVYRPGCISGPGRDLRR